ncbi:PEP-CTERM sorting domain-containing protein [Massilia sp. CCM 8695]|uniref:PEP-CTERM sorting domain-containing protein n=2 Tax=Massilia frigida TaxID=2609281 RepID=A0ABX0NIX8_9BURK|nr:PEP-CTERM sorting domain-containing protein [Massilia frigida]
MPFGNSTATVGATEWHVTASLNNPPLQDQFMQGFAMQRLYFDVTPATRVVFTADAVLSAADAGGRNAGWASVGFDGGFYPQQPLGTSIPIFSALETSDGNLSGTLRAELNTTQAGNAFLLVKAHALTTFTVTPVPEPASVTMLVAGLALVGGAAWRRRR